MARISVYIPDELLEEARRVRSSSVSGSASGSRAMSVSGSGSGHRSSSTSGSDTENTSQLVQRGLQCLINAQEQSPAYAQSPADGQVEIAKLRDRLVAEAQQDYAFGYAAALQAASAMSLHAVNALVDVGFDLRRWLEPFQNGFRYEELGKARPVEDPEEVKRLLLDAGKATPAHDERFKTNPWWWLFKTAEALGNLADPIGYDAYSFTPTRARERGFIDAMGKLWRAVEEPDIDATKPDDPVRDSNPPRPAKGRRSSSDADRAQP